MTLQAAAVAGPFGVADATARSLVNEAAREPQAVRMGHPFVASVRRAYMRLPESARPAAVTAAFAWAKAYVTAPAFATVYAAARAKAKPPGLATYDMSVDEEVQKQLDEKRAELEESKKGLGFLPEADRPAFLAALKEAEDRLRGPEMRQALRNDIESRRTADANGTNEAADRWNAAFPSDVRVFVRQELERFLAASADVDFTIPITFIKNPAGAIAGFVGPLERPPSSWIEAECMMAGKDTVSAGRAATEAWLKELPK